MSPIFSRPGGKVLLRAHAEGTAIAVEIADAGIGMSAEEIAVALTPFGQVDSRLERCYERTGLGLQLTKALVEAHGGSLRIESTPGAGTRVIVTFAVAASEVVRLAG